MKPFVLRGMGVALVTPFNEEKEIDYEALRRLVKRQVECGADFLVVLGTTAETPTLTHGERERVLREVREASEGKIALMAGVGGNDTRGVVEELNHLDLEGYSAVLSVVPFYNKPSQEGIFRHYAAVAAGSRLPVVLYNVPGRTGVNMTAETTLRIAREIDNVIGVKEASGNMVQIEQLLGERPEGFEVISGDDGITFPLMALGASGVISVVGNAYPAEFGRMVKLCSEGKFEEGRKLHFAFQEMIRLMFADGNPVGVKCAMNIMGLLGNELRLPLVAAKESTAAAMKEEMKLLAKRLAEG